MSRGSDWLKAHRDHIGDDCLLWPFSCCTPGYGQFYSNHQHQMAHRAMCIMVHGNPPSPYHHAAHSCGNRQCVNPKHLSWKTGSENQLDRHEQGSPFIGRRGRLSKPQVLEIRSLKGKETPLRLAERFGCTESNIRHVQNGTTYRF